MTADVLRFQAQGNELQGVRLFAVDNTSQPPRTQMNDQNFEFYLPEGAQVDSSFAQTEGGQAVNSAPVPQTERNRYAFVFPLRPGETQFQLTFHIPYSGSLQFDPKLLYATQHFVVMMPKVCSLPPTRTAFKPMKDPRQSDALVQVATKTTAGQPLAFKVSGTGLMPEQKEDQTGAQASAEPTPGGGLGPPIEAPDPLEKYRWYILGGFGLALTAGGIYIAKRPHAATVGDFAPADVEAGEAPARPRASQKSLLLEALKGRTVPARNGPQAGPAFAGRIREGQGRPRPNAGARSKAQSLKSQGLGLRSLAASLPLGKITRLFLRLAAIASIPLGYHLMTMGNTFKTALLLTLLTLLLMSIGRAFGGQNGMLLALAFAAVMNFVSYFFSDKIALAMYRAQPVTREELPRAYNIVERLTQKIGIPMPKLYVIPSESPNAFATGRNPQHASVAVTHGI